MAVSYATIIARGGGSGLHKKNLYPLLGKPVLQYAIENCLQAGFINKVFVWSEDHEVLEVAEKAGAYPIERPKHMVHYFSGFATPDQWGENISKQIMAHTSVPDDYRVSYNCNNLLIRPETLSKMYEKLVNDPGAFNILPVKKIRPGLCMINPMTSYLFPFWNAPYLSENDHPDLYRLAGVSISRMAFKLPEWDGKKKTLHHVISFDEGLDFQNEDDILFAEYYLNRRMRQNRSNLNASGCGGAR